MRRVWFLVLALVLVWTATATAASADDDFVFRRAKWGMTVEEVLKTNEALKDLPAPTVIDDNPEWPAFRYLVSGHGQATPNQLRLEYYFSPDTSDPPIPSLSSITVAIVLEAPPLTCREANEFGAIIGLPLPSCDSLADCRVKIGSILAKIYGPAFHAIPGDIIERWQTRNLGLSLEDSPRSDENMGCVTSLNSDFIKLVYSRPMPDPK